MNTQGVKRIHIHYLPATKLNSHCASHRYNLTMEMFVRRGQLLNTLLLRILHTIRKIDMMSVATFCSGTGYSNTANASLPPSTLGVVFGDAHRLLEVIFANVFFHLHRQRQLAHRFVVAMASYHRTAEVLKCCEHYKHLDKYPNS